MTFRHGYALRYKSHMNWLQLDVKKHTAIPANTKHCIAFVQRQPNVFDVGSTLYKCHTFFLRLLVDNFQRDIMFLPSLSWDIAKMLCLWARHFTLKCFTWLKWKWVPGRTEMAMCMISSMRLNSCSTVHALRKVGMTHEWTGPVTRG